MRRCAVITGYCSEAANDNDYDDTAAALSLSSVPRSLYLLCLPYVSSLFYCCTCWTCSACSFCSTCSTFGTCIACCTFLLASDIPPTCGKVAEAMLEAASGVNVKGETFITTPTDGGAYVVSAEPKFSDGAIRYPGDV